MKKNKLIAVITVLLFLPVLVCAQTDEIIDRAVKEYLRGDYSAAIGDFERALDEGENPKARQLLYKAIVAEGSRYYKKEDYEQAKKYLLQAKDINPQDTEVQNMLSEIYKATGISKSGNAPEKEIQNLKTAVASQRAATSKYRNTVNSLVAQRNNLRNEIKDREKEISDAQTKVEKLEKNLKDTSGKFEIIWIVSAAVILAGGILVFLILRKVYSTSSGSYYQLEELEEKIASRLDEADTESEELEERVARSINKMVDGQRDVVKNMALSAGSQAKNDIELIKDKLDDQFSRQQEKLLELLTMQAGALSKEKTEKVEVNDGAGGKRVITDVNPHVRARADGVELIPRTISDPSVAEKMLKPYLTDPNNRVRGNACVAIHQYNPELAIKTLEKMAESSGKWMRLSAAWAVGEISSPEVTHILRKLIDDIDERVKERAIKSFENMAEVKADIGAEIRKMIDKSNEE
ncbi:MAG: HEAT repeat domain-containing protein [Elusimicrobia bacterium]|jgi:tetratricopeptide (TPR) repeat protein|nr:HEAT repeat domain-containing protein [Elusimicrobiota bacterium]